MCLGQLMVDIKGTELTADEHQLLQHPFIGGVILFSRNYESKQQLCKLTTQIHGLRTPPLLIAVDHEGGRVQRFRADFTAIPSARQLGQLYQESKQKAIVCAQQMGWLLATELRAVGIDFSFAPVLDLDYGVSEVIGDRAYSDEVQIVAQLATASRQGMAEAGMTAVGKHFPGHGAVYKDSHHECPIDERSYEEIYRNDLQPFIHGFRNGLQAIMTAHVTYPQVDKQIASLSSLWLTKILRQQLSYQGVIFSDDLNMKGVNNSGSYLQRVEMALNAGSDMVLLCNNRPAVLQVIHGIKRDDDPVALLRLLRLHGRKNPPDVEQQKYSAKWQNAHQMALDIQQQRVMTS